MSFLADLLNTVFERRYRGASEPDHQGRSIDELCSDLLSSSGEVSGMVLARHILDSYAAMDGDGRHAFFTYLTDHLGIIPDEVSSALEAYSAEPSKSTYQHFMAASEPRRQELARRLNQVPGATKQLVEMRKDLLKLTRDHPQLAVVDLDLRHLFASWFNLGFLVLRPISWQSPADILDKIIAYEAVHAIHSWDDLRRRLQPADRRCFGFFHPAMPDEPLIFVEVALTKGIPASVQGLLADERDNIAAQAADTAVFYSISNCQAGLAGISFGNSLIKQVVADLSRELPNLKTFVTLSPIPGLNRWLEQAGAPTDARDAEQQRKIAAHYLLTAKRPNGAPYDPVARFHLGNGALIHAVHAGADLSENGLAQSGGAMVNYLYDLPLISQNHEQFASAHTVVASAEVTALSAAAQLQDT
ncbi:malonyl-CoA decarboxylase [Parasedimentitalea psychrophila]|uniref:Malonyl-CoA decarboxylase n=1 Tax=Parasedimentitalea psychrophila TaxID=2997337 RepID=A0A9Y2KWK9_9RHOB|nr:malonyl-CoA decarboxylase [Parasedimentitalea psychrophila]WIY23859.1 malonyl-CoA decarboxylase [Parasedimentitalea psychrophila]